MNTNAAINGLGLAEVKAAIALGETNRGAIAADQVAALDERLGLLRERLRRLQATDKRIAAVRRAPRAPRYVAPRIKPINLGRVVAGVAPNPFGLPEVGE
jgi:hypothetical protein